MWKKLLGLFGKVLSPDNVEHLTQPTSSPGESSSAITLTSATRDSSGGGGGARDTNKDVATAAAEGDDGAIRHADAESVATSEYAAPLATEATVSLDDSVFDFLDDVIAGKTDKLRKEMAKQKLRSAAEETEAKVAAAAAAAAATAAAGGDDTKKTSGENDSIVAAAPSVVAATTMGKNATGGGPVPGSVSATVAPSPSATTRYVSSAARSLQEYELVAYLGSGTFAEVTLARLKVSNQLFAIKKISKQKVKEEGCVERTFTERQLLANLRHAFLVQMHRAFQSRTHLYLVLDFAQGGDLFYFNQENLWVKDMQRSLRRMKYPYYGTAAGMAVANSSYAQHMPYPGSVVSLLPPWTALNSSSGGAAAAAAAGCSGEREAQRRTPSSASARHLRRSGCSFSGGIASLKGEDSARMGDVWEEGSNSTFPADAGGASNSTTTILSKSNAGSSLLLEGSERHRVRRGHTFHTKVSSLSTGATEDDAPLSTSRGKKRRAGKGAVSICEDANVTATAIASTAETTTKSRRKLPESIICGSTGGLAARAGASASATTFGTALKRNLHSKQSAGVSLVATVGSTSSSDSRAARAANRALAEGQREKKGTKVLPAVTVEKEEGNSRGAEKTNVVPTTSSAIAAAAVLISHEEPSGGEVPSMHVDECGCNSSPHVPKTVRCHTVSLEDSAVVNAEPRVGTTSSSAVASVRIAGMTAAATEEVPASITEAASHNNGSGSNAIVASGMATSANEHHHHLTAATTGAPSSIGTSVPSPATSIPQTTFSSDVLSGMCSPLLARLGPAQAPVDPLNYYTTDAVDEFPEARETTVDAEGNGSFSPLSARQRLGCLRGQQQQQQHLPQSFGVRGREQQQPLLQQQPGEAGDMDDGGEVPHSERAAATTTPTTSVVSSPACSITARALSKQQSSAMKKKSRRDDDEEEGDEAKTVNVKGETPLIFSAITFAGDSESATTAAMTTASPIGDMSPPPHMPVFFTADTAGVAEQSSSRSRTRMNTLPFISTSHRSGKAQASGGRNITASASSAAVKQQGGDAMKDTDAYGDFVVSEEEDEEEEEGDATSTSGNERRSRSCKATEAKGEQGTTNTSATEAATKRQAGTPLKQHTIHQNSRSASLSGTPPLASHSRTSTLSKSPKSSGAAAAGASDSATTTTSPSATHGLTRRRSQRMTRSEDSAVGTNSPGETALDRHKSKRNLKKINNSSFDACYVEHSPHKGGLLRGERKSFRGRHGVSAGQTVQELAGPHMMEGCTVTLPDFADDDSRFPLRLVAFYAIEMALALQYLHAEGFIYRDLKPENVLMRREGHIMLTDFGVAKYRRGAPSGRKEGAAAANTTTTTTTATTKTTEDGNDNNRSGDAVAAAGAAEEAERATSFRGTAHYMSPEMLQGLVHDSRTDWWSFGCVLFEWANGRKAFDSPNQFLLFCSIVEEDVKINEATDFKLTGLELHTRVAQMYCQYEDKLQQQQQQLAHDTRRRGKDCAESPNPSFASSLSPSFFTDSAGHIHTAITAPFSSRFSQSTSQQQQRSVGGAVVAADPSAAAAAVMTVAAVAAAVSTVSANASPTNVSFQVAPDGTVATASATTATPISAATLQPRERDVFLRQALSEMEEARDLLRDLILRVLCRDVEHRLCGADVLEHPFFTCQYITSQLYCPRTVTLQVSNNSFAQAAAASLRLGGSVGASEMPLGSAAAAFSNSFAFLSSMASRSPRITPLSTYAHKEGGYSERNGRDKQQQEQPVSAREPSLSGGRAQDNASITSRLSGADEEEGEEEKPITVEESAAERTVRPEAWKELFTSLRLQALYIPRLRARDDLRYFPSAVTATGLSAAVEQQKALSEAKEQKRWLVRKTILQAAQAQMKAEQDAIVAAEAFSRQEKSFCSTPSPLATPTSSTAGAYAAAATATLQKGNNGDRASASEDTRTSIAAVSSEAIPQAGPSLAGKNIDDDPKRIEVGKGTAESNNTVSDAAKSPEVSAAYIAMRDEKVNHISMSSPTQQDASTDKEFPPLSLSFPPPLSATAILGKKSSGSTVVHSDPGKNAAENEHEESDEKGGGARTEDTAAPLPHPLASLGVLRTTSSDESNSATTPLTLHTTPPIVVTSILSPTVVLRQRTTMTAAGASGNNSGGSQRGGGGGTITRADGVTHATTSRTSSTSPPATSAVRGTSLSPTAAPIRFNVPPSFLNSPEEEHALGSVKLSLSSVQRSLSDDDDTQSSSGLAIATAEHDESGVSTAITMADATQDEVNANLLRFTTNLEQSVITTPSGDDSALASLNVSPMRMPRDALAVTGRGSSHTNVSGGGSGKEELDLSANDLMARTAILPQEFVAAALAAAAAAAAHNNSSTMNIQSASHGGAGGNTLTTTTAAEATNGGQVSTEPSYSLANTGRDGNAGTAETQGLGDTGGGGVSAAVGRDRIGENNHSNASAMLAAAGGGYYECDALEDIAEEEEEEEAAVPVGKLTAYETCPASSVEKNEKESILNEGGNQQQQQQPQLEEEKPELQSCDASALVALPSVLPGMVSSAAADAAQDVSNETSSSTSPSASTTHEGLTTVPPGLLPVTLTGEAQLSEGEVKRCGEAPDGRYEGEGEEPRESSTHTEMGRNTGKPYHMDSNNSNDSGVSANEKEGDTTCRDSRESSFSSSVSVDALAGTLRHDMSDGAVSSKQHSPYTTSSRGPLWGSQLSSSGVKSPQQQQEQEIDDESAGTAEREKKSNTNDPSAVAAAIASGSAEVTHQFENKENMEPPSLELPPELISEKHEAAVAAASSMIEESTQPLSMAFVAPPTVTGSSTSPLYCSGSSCAPPDPYPSRFSDPSKTPCTPVSHSSNKDTVSFHGEGGGGSDDDDGYNEDDDEWSDEKDEEGSGDSLYTSEGEEDEKSECVGTEEEELAHTNSTGNFEGSDEEYDCTDRSSTFASEEAEEDDDDGSSTSSSSSSTELGLVQHDAERLFKRFHRSLAKFSPGMIAAAAAAATQRANTGSTEMSERETRGSGQCNALGSSSPVADGRKEEGEDCCNDDASGAPSTQAEGGMMGYGGVGNTVGAYWDNMLPLFRHYTDSFNSSRSLQQGTLQQQQQQQQQQRGMHVPPSQRRRRRFLDDTSLFESNATRTGQQPYAIAAQNARDALGMSAFNNTSANTEALEDAGECALDFNYTSPLNTLHGVAYDVEDEVYRSAGCGGSNSSSALESTQASNPALRRRAMATAPTASVLSSTSSVGNVSRAAGAPPQQQQGPPRHVAAHAISSLPYPQHEQQQLPYVTSRRNSSNDRAAEEEEGAGGPSMAHLSLSSASNDGAGGCLWQQPGFSPGMLGTSPVISSQLYGNSENVVLTPLPPSSTTPLMPAGGGGGGGGTKPSAFTTTDTRMPPRMALQPGLIPSTTSDSTTSKEMGSLDRTEGLLGRTRRSIADPGQDFLGYSFNCRPNLWGATSGVPRVPSTNLDEKSPFGNEASFSSFDHYQNFSFTSPAVMEQYYSKSGTSKNGGGGGTST